VLLGDGNGTFQTAVTYSLTGYAPLSVAVADVNGDGKPDIVVAIYCASIGNCNPYGPGAVDVLLGNGDGTFQPAVAYGSGGYGAQSVAAADVNGDGKLDVIVANLSACSSGCGTNGTVGVLLGNGNGTFQTAVTYNSGGGPGNSMVVADLNGDGKPDLVVANGNVGVLLGNGDGTFQAAVNYGSGLSGANSVAVADVNGDGKPDLVAATCGSAGCYPGAVGVLLGNGDGTFQAAVNYGSVGYDATSVAVADVNGDGKPDLLAVNYSCNTTCSNSTVSVLINTSIGPTTTTVVSSLNPSGFGQAVTLTATVKTQGYKGMPTGTVTFKDGATTLGTGTLNGSGVTTYTTSTLAAGQHSITAVYSGDANNAVSTSAALTETVQSSTTTTLASSANPAASGASVTFTATVAEVAPGTAIPTGTVTFKDGSTTLGTDTLNGSGVTTFSTSTLTVGSHSITAVYGGDANNLTSTSATLSQTVSPTDFTLSINPASATISSGQTASYTLTVTPQGSFTSQVSFTCGSLPTMATCTFTPPTLTPNTSTVTTTLMISTVAHSLLLPPTPRGRGPVIYPLGIAEWALALAGFLLFGTSAMRKQQQLYRRLLLASGLLILTGTIAGCALQNASSKPFTPPGTSLVQITASAPASASGSNAAASHTTTATLIVQ
jgi:hypothetical protein